MSFDGVVVRVSLLSVCFIVICNGQQMIRTSQCTYYGGGRKPDEAYSLSNCTWYRERSCCRHTEVTSVFQEMVPFNYASKECHNHMNYMMCYFCSPEQDKWFKFNKLHVCKDFCDALYKKCKDSSYQGKTIGKEYSNGQEFCEAQLFKVVSGGDQDCFDFDSSLFGSASVLSGHSSLTITLLAFFTKHWLL